MNNITAHNIIIGILIIVVICMALFKSPTIVVNEGPSKEDVQDMLDAQKEQLIQDYNLKTEDEAFERIYLFDSLMLNRSNWDSLRAIEFGR